MDKSLIVIISSFAISFFTTPLIIKYSIKKRLFVAPDKRKIHTRVTPSLGGIAIFLAFLISSLFFVNFLTSSEVRLVIVFVLLIFVLGLVDDLFHLTAKMKLIGQLLIVITFIVVSDVRLKSLGGLVTGVELSYLTSFSITTVAMIIIINSVNLIDGLDGLASTVAIISAFTLASWFYLTGHSDYALLLFALFGALVAFSIFNWEPSKIFMGDTGSLVIGMLLSIAIIKFVNTNSVLYGTRYGFQASITAAICFLSIPLIDTARIIVLRISKKQSPLKPDKNHIHHTLVKLGLSHSQTSLLLGAIHITFIGIAILFRSATDVIFLPGIVLLATLLCLLLERRIARRITTKEVE